MVAVTFVEHTGQQHVVETEAGTNLMEAATLNMVPGVIGMCGGICSCATCHCYVPPEWADRLEPAAPGESAMLEGNPLRKPHSRLGCQVIVTEALTGITVHLPENQDAG